MSSELDRRFTEHHFMWAPYLHGELGGAVDPAEESGSCPTSPSPLACQTSPAVWRATR